MATRHFSWLFAGCAGAALLLAPLFVSPAVAASASSAAAFTARYEHEADIEAELLTRAQAQAALSPSSAQFDAQITALNSEIAALYTSEQALQAMTAALSALPASEQLQALLTREAQLKTEQKTLNRQLQSLAAVRQRASAEKRLQAKRRQLRREIALVARTLGNVKGKLRHTAAARSRWRTHPEDGALQHLQTAIDELQSASIHVTLAWIQAENPGGEALKPARITGLTYAQAVVAKPGRHQPAVTDVVTVEPIVIGILRATLVDTGTYHLAGGRSHAGVRIDPVTGTLTVTSAAHPGTDIIIYTQDGVSEEVAIQIT
ncbi:MAG: hypothetical protein OWT27_05775 [Firmicutes bacterium]|nr:hypothetical protein [Bacillota bacterium]